MSTVLFQLSPSYANLFSHSYVVYNLAADSQTMENVTFKFSQVVKSTYYSSLIASVLTTPGVGPKSNTGSLSLDSLREGLSGALSNPARVEVNVEPSTYQLFIRVSVTSDNTNSLGGLLLAVSGLQLSALVMGLGAYYWIFPKLKIVRIFGAGLMGGTAIVIGIVAARQIFSVWPPFDPSFTWLFSLGVITGVAILFLYFVTERSRT